MKNKLYLLLAGLIILGSFGIMGCAKEEKNAKVTAEQLIGQDFLLVSLDGEAFPGDTPPGMRFDDNMRISGNFCNRYTGTATLEGGTIKVGQMASTKMACANGYLNNLERVVPAMLMDGADLSLENDRLYIRQGGHEVIYKKAR